MRDLPLQAVPAPEPQPELSLAEQNTFLTGKRVLLAALALAVVVNLLERFTHGVVARPFQVYIVGFDPMRASAMLAAALLYFILPRRHQEMAAVLAIGLLLEGAMFTSRPPSWSFTDRLRCTGIGLGAVSLVAIALRGLIARGVERQKALGLLCLALILPTFPFVSDWGHREVIRATPLVYDQFAYRLDGLAGFQPAFIVEHFVWTHARLSILVMTAYEELPLMLMIAVVLTMLFPRRRCNNVLLAFSLMAAAGAALYVVYPLIGIQMYAGADAWKTGIPPPPADPATLFEAARNYPRNSMPSLHMAWILSIFWAVCRINSIVRALGAVAVCLTVAATLYVGHYAIDLIAAFPFALTFMGLTARRTETNRAPRLAAIATGATLTAVTLCALRFGSPWLIAHPAVTLTAAAVLVVVPVVLESWLARTTLSTATQERTEALPLAVAAG